jgi:peptide/nickel transport system permease protein
MLPFIMRRLVGAILVLFAVSVLVFAIFVIVPSGDPAVRIAGRNANDQLIENIRHSWGFDKPYYTQYWLMMKKTFSGELKSYTNQTSVTQQIREGLPATFSLSIGAAAIWLFFGVLVGIIAAVKAGKFSDRLVTILALIGISMPVFWLGIIARYYFAEKRTWFPDGEYVPLVENPAQWFYHLILPWLVLAVLFIGFYGRVMRSNILDTINEDYVRTARAKGIDPRRVMAKHVLRNSMIPIVTLFGLDFAGVLGGGAILTETVFDLHGVGQYAAQSVRNFDLPPIMGVALYGAFFIVLFNAIVDFLYAYLDPRIRPT